MDNANCQDAADIGTGTEQPSCLQDAAVSEDNEKAALDNDQTSTENPSCWQDAAVSEDIEKAAIDSNHVTETGYLSCLL